MRINPFSPGGLVPAGVFTGRIEESESLERMLVNTKHGNPQHFLLHGERGIGKSSLMWVHDLTASGQLDGWGSVRYNFLTLNVMLEPSDTYESIIRKLGRGLRRQIDSVAQAKALAKDAWEFLKHWEVMGVKYRAAEVMPVSPSEWLDELSDSYAKACLETAEVFDGILILIDEADKPPISANLGALLKGFSERLARSQRNVVCIGIAGVSTVLDTLRASHESSLRLFTTFHLQPLSLEEGTEVVRKGLERSKEMSSIETTITEEAETTIAFYSEGYPHFIQQFAYCAFERSKGTEITGDDVRDSAWGEHGAFAQLGTKYFQDLYFDKIGSDDYREVLQYMAQHFDDWVSKEQIRANTSLKESTLTNALKALIDRRIILPQPGKRGLYRLPLRSFAVWIRAFNSFPGKSQYALKDA